MDEVERLVAEFLDCVCRSEHPVLEDYLARLATEQQRAEFRELLRYALTVENAPRQALGPGAMLGPYRLDAQVGAGGMGVVYRAFDTNLHRHVAIKVLPPQRAGDAAQRARLEQESRVLARLRHPGIVAVHEAGNLADLRYFVMDLVAGLDLAAVLERLATRRTLLRGADLLDAVAQALPPGHEPLLRAGEDWWRTVARFTRELARAVEAAHGQGVLHRDLKPANVMVTAGGHPVVLDFGIASAARQADGTIEGLSGTWCYLAPEQVRLQQTGFDQRTDVFQIGLILYELLTLRRAYPHERITDGLPHVREGRIDPPRGLAPAMPPDLEAICLEAVEADPERRYPSARALGDDLQRFLEGRPTEAHPPSLPRRGLMLLRRNRTVTAAAAIALLGVGAGVWAWSGPVTAGGPFEGFRLKRFGGDFQTVPLGAGEAVHPNDVLGLRMELAQPTVVYVVSVTGTRPGQPEFAVPIRPKTRDVAEATLNGQDPPTRLEWGLELPAGRHEICLIKVGSIPEGKDSWHEGLFVFYSPQEHSWIERWLAGLKSMRLAGAPGVPYDEAMTLLRAPQVRGDSLDRLSAAELERIRERLKSQDLVTSETWPVADPRFHKVYYPVLGQ